MKDIITEIKNQITQAISKSVESISDNALKDIEIEIETPKEKEHGDFSSNIAMKLARVLKTNPRAIAQKPTVHILIKLKLRAQVSLIFI